MEENNDLSIIDLNRDVITVIISKLHFKDLHSLILSNKRFAKIVAFNIQYIQNMFLKPRFTINKSFHKYKYKQLIHSGKKHGLCESWHSNNNQWVISNYNNGLLDGLYESWHFNGDIHERNMYKMNKLDGICELYEYPIKGFISLKNITNYKNGIKNGIFEQWKYFEKLKQNILISRCNYTDNVINGLVEKWYEDDGSIFERYNVILNKKEGLYTEWYKNDRLRLRCNYVDNKLDGLYELFYVDGSKKELVNYKNGYKSGLREKWYKSGIIKESFTYVNRKKCGLQEKWSKDGTKIFSVLYKNGIKQG